MNAEASAASDPGGMLSPNRVLLFSGHRVDAPGRAKPRFPATQVGRAALAIASALDSIGAAPGDLALTQGAAGGDLLFAEACHARGVRVRLMLPMPEPRFVAQSILPSADGAHWLDRWRALREKLLDAPQVMPDAPEPAPPANAFARCNLWMLETALAYGASRLVFLCLWNGADGDGPGGTAQMVEAVRRRAGRVHWIDTRALW